MEEVKTTVVKTKKFTDIANNISAKKSHKSTNNLLKYRSKKTQNNIFSDPTKDFKKMKSI